MTSGDTLLGYLVPRLTRQVEVAATKALAYILNRPGPAKEVFNDFLQGIIGPDLQAVDKVVVEESYEDDGNLGRLDFVGYDKGVEKRVIGEAKFEAALGKGQGSGYLQQLSNGTSVLLFVVPEYRLDHLWNEVVSDVKGESTQRELVDEIQSGPIRRARVMDPAVRDSQRFLMMVSWRHLLERMLEGAFGQPDVQADIRQLLGLTEKMDDDKLLPFTKADISPQLAERMRDLRRIYDDVIARCKDEEWVTSWHGTSRYPQSAYGQFWQLSGLEGWFGVYYRLWARGDCENTPFWLELYNCDQRILDEICRRFRLKMVENMSIPIQLKLGAERLEIVNCIVAQLQGIAETIKAGVPDA